MQCPYCKKDLQYAIRLLGNEGFSMHIKMHEADLINSVFQQLDMMCEHAKIVSPRGSVADLLDKYLDLKDFYKIVKESQNENLAIHS